MDGAGWKNRRWTHKQCRPVSLESAQRSDWSKQEAQWGLQWNRARRGEEFGCVRLMDKNVSMYLLWNGARCKKSFSAHIRDTVRALLHSVYYFHTLLGWCLCKWTISLKFYGFSHINIVFNPKIKLIKTSVCIFIFNITIPQMFSSKNSRGTKTVTQN